MKDVGMSDIEARIAGGLTAKGSDLLSKQQFFEVIAEADERNFLVSNAEAYDVDGQIRFLDTEFSFTFSDDRRGVAWPSKVASSIAYATEIVADAPAGTLFKVWLQQRG